MKKGFLVILMLSIIFPVFSASIPENLYGIWEGKDRFVFFEMLQNDRNPELVVCLKEYYGWYIDRTAEPERYNNVQKRSRNSGTTHKAINIQLNTQKELYKDLAYEFQLSFSNYQENLVPFLIFDNRIYLDFYIQNEELPYFYMGNAVSKGFLVSQQSIPENIACYIIDNNKLFNVRYWKTDMDYSEGKVTFEYDENKYEIPRHIYSCGNVYTCVNGRGKYVRNTQPPADIIEKNINFVDEKKIIILDEDKYLQKLADKNTFEDLMQIIAEANSKRKPDPKPLFPLDNLNWHWDIIDYLEKDNLIIQSVRKRQIDFGSRGR